MPDGPSAPPDWEKVPFEAGCARCGHNLRGMSEPVCPACGLKFDWADAVPIEQLTCLKCGYHLYGLRDTRCPECGEAFSWAEVLDDYHRRRKPVFEYQWRTQPVRAFLRSFRLAVQPKKLWTTIDIHDPPPITALVLLLIVSATLFTASPFAAVHTAGWIIRALERLGSGPQWFYLGPWNQPDVQWGGWIMILVSTSVWCTAGFGVLMLLRQSMQRCRVRNGHIFRVYAYAMLPIAGGSVLYCLVALVYDGVCAVLPYFALYETVTSLVGVALATVIWQWTFRCIAVGYKLYIGMRHAWSVAAASQIVGFLSALIVTIWWQIAR